MRKLFIESSALFAMCDSPSGASRELLKLALRGHVQLYTSTYVLRETGLHLSEKRARRAVVAFRYVCSRAVWNLVDPTREEVVAAIPTTPDAADAPIVAAARKAAVDALVTFDRRHLIRSSVADYIGAAVATPSQALKQIKAQID